MKTIITIAFVVAPALLALSAVPVDEDKPYGRACVAVVDSNAADKEEAFRGSSSPGPGKKIRVYLDASAKCTAVVAALRKDGKLAYGWRPQVVDLAGESEEVQLPQTPSSWDWLNSAEPFEFYIVFLPPGTKDMEELKKLTSAMQDGKADERLLALQTNKFREVLSRLAAEKDRASQVVAEPEVGGVFRGSAFPWRQYASGVNFSPERAGVLIVPSARDTPPAAKP